MNFPTPEQIINLDTKIRAIHEIMGDYSDFKGYEADDTGITVREEQYYSGCGTERNSFYIPYEDLDKPIEYFKQQKIDALEREKQRELEQKEREKENKINEEKKLLVELKKKYES